jgi:hypothetical protein
LGPGLVYPEFIARIVSPISDKGQMTILYFGLNGGDFRKIQMAALRGFESRPDG